MPQAPSAFPCNLLQAQLGRFGQKLVLRQAPAQVGGGPQVPPLQTQFSTSRQSPLVMHPPPQICGAPHVPEVSPRSLLHTQPFTSAHWASLVQVPAQVCGAPHATADLTLQLIADAIGQVRAIGARGAGSSAGLRCAADTLYVALQLVARAVAESGTATVGQAGTTAGSGDARAAVTSVLAISPPADTVLQGQAVARVVTMSATGLRGAAGAGTLALQAVADTVGQRRALTRFLTRSGAGNECLALAGTYVASAVREVRALRRRGLTGTATGQAWLTGITLLRVGRTLRTDRKHLGSTGGALTIGVMIMIMTGNTLYPAVCAALPGRAVADGILVLLLAGLLVPRGPSGLDTPQSTQRCQHGRGKPGNAPREALAVERGGEQPGKFVELSIVHKFCQAVRERVAKLSLCVEIMRRRHVKFLLGCRLVQWFARQQPTLCLLDLAFCCRPGFPRLIGRELCPALSRAGAPATSHRHAGSAGAAAG